MCKHIHPSNLEDERLYFLVTLGYKGTAPNEYLQAQQYYEDFQKLKYLNTSIFLTPYVH